MGMMIRCSIEIECGIAKWNNYLERPEEVFGAFFNWSVDLYWTEY